MLKPAACEQGVHQDLVATSVTKWKVSIGWSYLHRVAANDNWRIWRSHESRLTARESYFLLSSDAPVERKTQGRAGLECAGDQHGIGRERLRLPDEIAWIGEGKIAAVQYGVRSAVG